MPMPFGTVTINGNEYTLAGIPQRYSLDPIAPVVRDTGIQLPSALTERQEVFFPSPIWGYGRARITDITDVRQLLSSWDSKVDTRWSAGVRLPPLEQDPTKGSNDEVLRAAVPYKGKIVTLWEDSTTVDPASTGTNCTETNRVRSRIYNGSTNTYEGGGYLAVDFGAQTDKDAIEEKVALDIQAPGNLLIALRTGIGQWVGGVTKGICIYTSSDGATWTFQKQIDLLTNVVTANENIDGGKILPSRVNGESVIALWDEDASKINLYSSTDDSTWTLELSIVSGGGPKGIVVATKADGTPKIMLGTREGVHEIDVAGTWTSNLLEPMPAHDDNCRQMANHNGSIWAPQGVADDEPAGMVRLTASGEGWHKEKSVGDDGTKLGLDAFDGVPSDMLGPFVYLDSAGDFLFAVVGGGAASRQARILCHNGYGWHYMMQNGTANQKIDICFYSADSDGTPRLHYGKRTATNNTSAHFLGNPLVNPQSGVAISYAVSGILDMPDFDGGLPRYDAAWLAVHEDAVDLSADNTGEYIKGQYGLNGAARTTATLANSGEFISSRLINNFAANNISANDNKAGIAGRSVALRRTFYRGATTTNTPISRGLTLIYYKQVEDLERFVFPISARLTAQAWRLSSEDVLDKLETAAALSTLPAFSYGKSGLKYGTVRLVSNDGLSTPTGQIDQGLRQGLVLVEIKEKL